MHRTPLLRNERSLGFSGTVALAALLSLAGCSGTTTDPTPQAGGSGGAASTTGGTTAMNGGTAGTSGAPGTGGSAGGTTGTAGNGQALVVNCTNTTYQAALSNCTLVGCHSPIYPASGMNLTPDSGLVGRLKDVPAKHDDIVCDAAGDICVPSTCPPSGQALLVDSADYTQSWILTKLSPQALACGDQMPGTAFKTPNDLACIQAMIRAIAALPK